MGKIQIRHLGVSILLPQSAEKGSLEQLLAELRRDPAVEWAEPNYRRYPQELPDDPMFGSQWHERLGLGKHICDNKLQCYT